MKRILLLLPVLALLGGACVGGKLLRTGDLESTAVIQGSFRLILFGGTYLEDPQAVAVLDIEGDGYTIVPHAPEFRYSVFEGLTAPLALEKAGHFATSQVNSSDVLRKKIFSPEGGVIGYEVRPLYQTFVYGFQDIIDVDYYLREGGEVRMVVRTKDQVEKLQQERGEGFRWGR